MQKSAIYMACAAFVATTPLQAIELTDYSDPESKYEEAYVNGQFNSKSGNQDQTSFDLTINADYETNYSSLQRNWSIQLDGAWDAHRGPNDGDDTEDSGAANALGFIDNYFTSGEKAFWFSSGELNYLDDADEIRAKIGGGVGYGRVINATPLAYVLRIEEELREAGVLTGSISDATYIELARIIAREDEFKSRYGADEYRAHWFTAFEEVLKKEGVLSDSQLQAAGALTMHRVVSDERVSVRKHGWLARAGVGLLVQDFQGESGDPTLDLLFEYALPHGYRGQFLDLASYSAKLDGSGDQLFRNAMSYTFEITDLIDWESTWDLTLELPDEGNDILSNRLASTFRYYLSNRLNLNATVSLSDVEDDIDDNGNDDVDVATFFGVGYRLK